MKLSNRYAWVTLAIFWSATAIAVGEFNYDKADRQIGKSVSIDGEQGMLRFYEEYFRASLAPSGELIHTAKMSVRPSVEEMQDPTAVAEALTPEITQYASLYNVPFSSEPTQQAGQAAEDQGVTEK